MLLINIFIIISYRLPSVIMESDNNSYMLFIIIFWIITEALLTASSIFAVLTLSRINRKD